MNFEASFVVENKIEYSIWDIWDIDDAGIKDHWMCAQLELKIVDKCGGVILYGVMTGLEFKKFKNYAGNIENEWKIRVQEISFRILEL